MWKWLPPYVKPDRAYRLAGSLLPWFAVFTFLLPRSTGATWGNPKLKYALAQQQGDAQ